jgi:hypothetical protein
MESGEHTVEEVSRRIRVLTMGARTVQPAHFRVLSTALAVASTAAPASPATPDRRAVRARCLAATARALPRQLVSRRLVPSEQALRTFAVDAIDEATVLEQPAIEVKDETLDRHLTSGYGIFAGVHTQEAVLLFNATRARWVATEVWHPQQDGKLQLDGGYLLKLPYSREPELVMDILKYGADVEVLSPESLRTAVANQLRDAARLYERKR